MVDSTCSECGGSGSVQYSGIDHLGGGGTGRCPSCSSDNSSGLVSAIFVAGLVSLISFGAINVANNQREKKIKANTSLVYQVKKIAFGDDYTASDEEGRKLIEKLGLTYPGKGREHLLQLHPTKDGAKWCFASTPWNREFIGEIPRGKLEGYVKAHRQNN